MKYTECYFFHIIIFFLFPFFFSPFISFLFLCLEGTRGTACERLAELGAEQRAAVEAVGSNRTRAGVDLIGMGRKLQDRIEPELNRGRANLSVDVTLASGRGKEGGEEFNCAAALLSAAVPAPQRSLARASQRRRALPSGRSREGREANRTSAGRGAAAGPVAGKRTRAQRAEETDGGGEARGKGAAPPGGSPLRSGRTRASWPAGQSETLRSNSEPIRRS